MELNRAGNPLQIYWDFNVKKSDGIVEAFPLEGKPLRLTLITPRGKKEIKDFKAHGNVIEWLFSAQYQTTYGDHSLLLEVLSPTGKVLSASDQCKFIRIVDKSCMSSDNDIVVDGETKTLTLSTEMSVVRIMPVVPEVGENGNWWVDGEDTGKPSTGAIDPALRVEINNKADKSSVPTKTSQLTNDSGFITKDGVPAPDWNASTYKEGHIKNRTHHMQDYMCQYFKGSPIKISKPSGVGYVLLAYDTDLPEKFIRIEIKANESKTEEFLDSMGMPLIFTWDAGASTINVESFGGAVETYSMRAYYSSSAKGFDEYFIALDEGFIPEEVARKSELKTINGQSILGEGDIEIKGGSSTFVTDFTVNDLYELVYRGAHPVQANIVALQRALENKERIVVPYGTEEYKGYSILQGYYEDLVYFTVADENGSTYVVEVGYDAGEIDRDNVTHVSPKENKINIADLQKNIAARNVGAVDVEGGAEAPDAPSGGSYDDTEIKERLEEQDQLIEDLQNMKIDREADDYYPKLAVGLADNLAGVDVVDSKINFRRSGGGAITDGVARIESIKGNSVVWNQVINADDYRTYSSTITRDSDGWYNVMVSAQYGRIVFNIQNLITNHQYLISYEIVKDSFGMSVYFDDGFYPHVVETSNALNGVYKKIVTYTEKGSPRFIFQDNRASGWTSWKLRNVQIIDLTKMFGAGNEPTTIEEFYQRIPMGVDLNAYNEGEVIHMDVQSIESQGLNAWDEEITMGAVKGDGTFEALATRISTSLIEVLPNKTYYLTGPSSAYDGRYVIYDENKRVIYADTDNGGTLASKTFTTPSNAKYACITFGTAYGTTYNHDICINISDTSINGKYFPYIKRVEELSIIRKYFPQGMKSAGTAHDEIRYNKASGKWEYSKGRLKAVDLGSLTWNYYSSSNTFLFKAQFADIKIASSNDVANMLCAPYTANNANAWQGDKTIVATPLSGVQIWIHDEAYKDNLEAFKAAIQGVILYYEPNDWEWVELDEADQFKDLDYQVWNCGTEKAIAEGKSAPLAADITYGFNAIGKIKELESLVAQLRAKVGI